MKKSYQECCEIAENDLRGAGQATDSDEARNLVASAQVWATLALAEAIRESVAALNR
ncbi:MAG: hypothetical protein M3460_17580 [Actinomycetota bacterium]|nr:hypothetical protein [Actinomycetota bacterium]